MARWVKYVYNTNQPNWPETFMNLINLSKTIVLFSNYQNVRFFDVDATLPLLVYVILVPRIQSHKIYQESTVEEVTFLTEMHPVGWEPLYIGPPMLGVNKGWDLFTYLITVITFTIIIAPLIAIIQNNSNIQLLGK